MMADFSVSTISSYKSGKFVFPPDEIPTSQKTESWAKKWCEAMVAMWVTDRCGIPYSKMNEFRELRDYGAGTQSVDRYQKILLDESEDDDELTGFVNIMWDNFSVMPKFKHIIRGMFENQEHDIVASAIDPLSLQEKSVNKLRKWFKARYKPLLDAVYDMTGYKPPQEWLPENVQELELYERGGGFKLAKEKNIEEGITYSLYISDWKEIKRKILDDFVDINCAAVKDYTDPYTRKVKVRYIDPANLIIQYSKHWDYRNAEYGGEIIRETISNIRKVTDLTEDQLRTIAQFYNGRNGNPNIDSWMEDDLQTNTGWAYDSFMIDVLDAEKKSINSKYFTRRTNKYGETLFYEQPDEKIYDRPGKKTEIKKYQVVYRAKWIIGTDFVYDFGLQYDVPRPGKKEVEISYKFYKLPGRSLVSLARPNLDQLSLTWYKTQNAIAMAANSGIAVEYTSLQNMKLGGNKMEPLEVLSVRRDTGDLVYKLTTVGGRPNVPGGIRPIQELEGGIGRQLEEYIKLFEINVEFIRDLTGINRIADASTPDPSQSVGGSQLAVAATNNALRPIYAGYIRLKEKAAKSMALRIQMLVRHDKKAYSGYIPVMGSSGVKILSVGADDVDMDCAIRIVARPTEKRKETILETAKAAMIPDRDGYVGLEYRDFLIIERMVEEGNLKFAEMYLAARSEKSKERQEKLQKENMEYNAKMAQQTEQVKSQEAMRQKQFESELSQKEKILESELEIKVEERKHLMKMEEIRLEKSLTEPAQT